MAQQPASRVRALKRRRLKNANIPLQPLHYFGIILLACSYAVAGMVFAYVAELCSHHLNAVLPGKPLPALTEYYLSIAAPVSSTAVGLGLSAAIIIGGIVIIRRSKQGAFPTLFLTLGWFLLFLFILGALSAFALPYATITYSLSPK